MDLDSQSSMTLDNTEDPLAININDNEKVISPSNSAIHDILYQNHPTTTRQIATVHPLQNDTQNPAVIEVEEVEMVQNNPTTGSSSRIRNFAIDPTESFVQESTISASSSSDWHQAQGEPIVLGKTQRAVFCG